MILHSITGIPLSAPKKAGFWPAFYARRNKNHEQQRNPQALRIMNMQNSMILKIACFYGAVTFPLTAMAQADKVDLGLCYAITDSSERLACYDALARLSQDTPDSVSQTQAPAIAEPAAPANRPEPARTAAAAAPVRANPAVSTVESFGEQQARIEADAEGEEALIGTVAAIDEREPRKMEITLSNGQVWKQSVGKSFLLRENDTVRITRNPWGSSFRLQKDGKPGYIQVLRLR